MMRAGTVMPVFHSATEDSPAAGGRQSATTLSLTLHITQKYQSYLHAVDRMTFLMPQRKSSSSVEYGVLGQDVLFWGNNWPALQFQRSRLSPINGFRLATWNIHSLRHKYITVADTILAWSPIRGTALQLTLWFVDLHRRATPTFTAQE